MLHGQSGAWTTAGRQPYPSYLGLESICAKPNELYLASAMKPAAGSMIDLSLTLVAFGI